MTHEVKPGTTSFFLIKPSTQEEMEAGRATFIKTSREEIYKVILFDTSYRRIAQLPGEVSGSEVVLGTFCGDEVKDGIRKKIYELAIESDKVELEI